MGLADAVHVRLLTAARILPRLLLSPHRLALVARVRPLRARRSSTSPGPPRALSPASLDPVDTLPDVSSLTWPTPHIDDGLFDVHLPELYAAGWHVTYADSAALSKNLVVPDWKSAVQLATDIGALATEEKHHPVMTVAPGDPPTLTVRLTTHSCQRMPLDTLPGVQNDGAGASAPVVDPVITVDAATNAIADTPSDEPASFFVAPGLTAPDLRLAWRIDRLYAASLSALNGIPSYLPPPAAAHAHPPTLAELLRPSLSAPGRTHLRLPSTPRPRLREPKVASFAYSVRADTTYATARTSTMRARRHRARTAPVITGAPRARKARSGGRRSAYSARRSRAKCGASADTTYGEVRGRG